MDNLRWILIFAGVAILVALWLSGRSGRRPNRGHASAARTPDPLLGDDPLDDGFGDALGDGFGDVDPDDFARPGAPVGELRAVDSRVRRAARSPLVPAAAGFDEEPGFDPEPLPVERSRGEPDEGRSARAPSAPAQAFGVLTQKFEAIGEKLAPNRRRRVVESARADDEPEAAERPYASKIVMLHVVAPSGEILPPEGLRDMFERRGYHHGDMDIYHSLYEGKPVFSVARMIKPGTFDLDDLATFETPGLALILQLPGPVAADTAFEVMLSEAFEMAEELGGTVLDGDRSTLGRQTEQHLREGIHEYMHRQKYFDSVA